MKSQIQAKVPKCLKDHRQWVVWDTMHRHGEPTKVPVRSDNGRPASSADPDTWSDFRSAHNAYFQRMHDGVGFMFSEDDPFVGIDLDGCRNPETGEIAEWAKEIIRGLDSYSEVSPSQTGVKIWVRGKSPYAKGRNEKLPDMPRMADKEPGIEVYERGRYFAVTGLKLANVSGDVEDRSDVLADVLTRVLPKEKRVDRSMSRPDPCVDSQVVDRARKYLSKIPPAISGQGGHNRTYHAACVLVLGFGLNQDEALPLIREWNNACEPPWTESELIHKLEDADKEDGERNYLRHARPDEWPRISVPKYESPPPRVELKTLRSATERYLESVRTGQKSLIELGLPDVDYAIAGGIEPGEMAILAGRPSHGKTAVALQVLQQVTFAGRPAILISEEMSEIALGKRSLQFISSVPEEHWRTSIDEVESDVDEHYGRRADCFVVESVRTAERACDAIRTAVNEHRVEVAVIDYAQLLSSPGKGRYEQITNTSVALRQVASETGVALITLAQLNREIESRDKYIPRMSDLRDTGQLEQDADVVIFLVWPHRMNRDVDPHYFQFFIAKNRNRAINETAVACRFSPTRQMFTYQRSLQPSF